MKDGMIMDDLRTAFVGFYLTEKEKKAIVTKALADNRTVSDYVRMTMVGICEGAPRDDGLTDRQHKEILEGAYKATFPESQKEKVLDEGDNSG